MRCQDRNCSTPNLAKLMRVSRGLEHEHEVTCNGLYDGRGKRDETQNSTSTTVQTLCVVRIRMKSSVVCSQLLTLTF